MELQQGTIKELTDKKNFYETRIAGIEKEIKEKKIPEIHIQEELQRLLKKIQNIENKSENDQNQIDNKLVKIYDEK